MRWGFNVGSVRHGYGRVAFGVVQGGEGNMISVFMLSGIVSGWAGFESRPEWVVVYR